MSRALLVLTLLAAGCAKSTELLVTVGSNLVVPTEVNVLSLVVTRAGETQPLFSKTYALPAEATLPASLDLHGGDATVQIDVALALGSTQVVTRRAILPFLRDHALELRLELDRSCEDVSCSEGLTCIAGTCQTPQVDPTTLPPIGQKPLEPLDGGGPALDLSAADLGSAPDLGGCTAVPAPPMTGQCQVYEFSSNAIPLALKENAPSDFATSFACGRLHIATTATVHDTYGTFYRLDLPRTTSNYSMKVSYHDELGDNAWVGLLDSDVATGFVFDARTLGITGDGSDGDRYQVDSLLAGSTSFTQLDQNDTFATGAHVLTLVRQAGADKSAKYAITVDGLTPKDSPYPVSASSQSGTQVPSFFIGNDSGAIDVQLDWIVLCALP